MFTVLPFGLSSACYLFTKLLRPLARYWRSRGLRIVVYLDDCLCAVNGLVSAKLASEMVRYTLSRAGFVTHPTKSVWEPTQCLVWLGFKLDLAMGLIRIPDDKLVALSQVLMHYSLVVCAPARKIASVVVKIISLGLAIGPASRFMTRSLYAVIEGRCNWGECLVLTNEAHDELVFWRENLPAYDSQPIWHSPSALRVVYSDASDTGYGGYVVEHGPWSVDNGGSS